MVKVFLSSTGLDLQEYRKAAIDVCNRLQVIPIAMEHFEAMGAGATEGSKRKLKDADVYVGIFAHRYGYIEAGYDKSVTEIEFDSAAGMDRLCFVVDPKLPWPPASMDIANYPRLEAFKTRINALIRMQFDSVADFSLKLYQSLSEWLKNRRAARVELRDAFDSLLSDYQLFGGREDVLDRVQEFLRAPAGGYLTITAPAGFGKTALMARLIHDDVNGAAYHFFTSASAESRSEEFFLRNMVQQMAAWHPGSQELPAGLNDLRRRYSELVSQKPPGARTVLIDGLDEVHGWSLRRYLSLPVAENLHVVVTIRDLKQDWTAEYGFPAVQTRHLELSGLTRSDIEAILKEASPAAAAFAADANLLDKVVAAAAYPADPTAGADPLYLRFLVEDIDQKRITAANIDAQPLGMEEYLDDWWQEIKETARDVPARDLLGTLTAALGAVNRQDLEAICPSLVDEWIKDFFEDVLGRMRRAVSGNDVGGYTLAHPRLKAYLQKTIKVKTYADRLVAHCEAWRVKDSPYAMTYLVRHLDAAGRAADVFATVLDGDFQKKQRSIVGNIHQSLTDLRLAIRTAAGADDLVNVLACCGAYRRLVRAEGLTRAIFDGVGKGDFESALQHAASYVAGGKASGKWHQVLRCYLAWEAAEAGDAEARQRCLALYGRHRAAPSHTDQLCNALLDRAAGSLAPPPAPTTAQLTDVEQRMNHMEYAIGDVPNPTAVSMVEFIDEERAGDYTATMQQQLISVARAPHGQTLIDRGLNMALSNPYPRYRDNALVAIGVACVMVPDPRWARQRLQAILRTALDEEGVTFTFDIAAQLDAEARRRGNASPVLADYLKNASDAKDRWGTALRAHSARASAMHWQGGDAAAEIDIAIKLDDGFAGFMSIHLLALINRCHETAKLDRFPAANLLGRSAWHAGRVRDPGFRDERVALVDAYRQWLAREIGFDELETMLAEIADPDARRVLKDLCSARWTHARQAQDLKRLIPASLSDGTALDFTLARLLALSLAAQTDSVVRQIIAIAEHDFTYSRPWAMKLPESAKNVY